MDISSLLCKPRVALQETQPNSDPPPPLQPRIHPSSIQTDRSSLPALTKENAPPSSAPHGIGPVGHGGHAGVYQGPGTEEVCPNQDFGTTSTTAVRRNNDDRKDSPRQPCVDTNENPRPHSGPAIAKNERDVVINTVLDQCINPNSNGHPAQAVSATKSQSRFGKRATGYMLSCSDCKKQFKRICDLRKHKNVHSRQWKCSEKGCKYFEIGFLSEKDLKRHITDKHSSTSLKHLCTFAPCAYGSTRETNCKAHMEKWHGWIYIRTKGNGCTKVPISDDHTSAI